VERLRISAACTSVRRASSSEILLVTCMGVVRIGFDATTLMILKRNE
jgi:hypothetical protein